MKFEFRMNKLSATLYNGDSELVSGTELMGTTTITNESTHNRTIALDRTAAEATGVLKCIVLAPNLHPRFCCCQNTFYSLHGGFLTYVLYHHRETSNQISKRKRLITHRYSVGRCVIPCAFFGKSVKHTFSCRKMYSV